ncbi:phytanoyl-CoA dioxygenase family protein [Ralstonia flaminis]|jgi:hypothetical protein|uniref:Phytanoyl-CoA dioxygenase n=1 Tax=Ralstonia flaminis TaxID=3058597 RepID=A0ABN9JQX0_9RALS|nr:phytanoyl-CoA dioxygenase family protein [Ralstonia sp. LMG 18101]CAJ0817783.1 hypothetical protein LMG18101_03387 [Ralstonia sp. LMG 18101]
MDNHTDILSQSLVAFSNDGYVHIPNLIDAALIGQARLAQERMDAKLEANHRATHHMHRPKGNDFLDLAPLYSHAGLVAFADAILGEPCSISMVEFGVTPPEDMNSRGPGDPHTFGYFYLGNMGAHRDGGWIEEDLCVEHPPMLTFKAAIWLDDVPAEGGNLLLYPGTHRMSPQAIRRLDLEVAPQHAVVARAGDVTLFDRRLLHSRTWNRGTATRLVMFVEFSVPWIRRKQDWQLPPECCQLSIARLIC